MSHARRRTPPARADRRLEPTEAKAMLVRKAGTLEGAYYSVGLEVPPRRHSTFSMRYTTVPSARFGFWLLRLRMQRKRVGMAGEVVLFSANGRHSVSLGGYVRRAAGVLEPFPGDYHRGALQTQRQAGR